MKTDNPNQLHRKPNRQGRNELCLCGSGKKYKLCCQAKHEQQRVAETRRLMASVPRPAQVDMTPEQRLQQMKALQVLSLAAHKSWEDRLTTH